MEWTDTGVVLWAHKHGESAAIVHLLTSEHGRHAGMVKGISSKAQRGLYQPGNLVRVTWRARLEEHLGNYAGELVTAYAASYLAERDRLSAIASAAALLQAALPERQPEPELYKCVHGFFNRLDNPGWAIDYINFEYNLLAAQGYVLDLQQCAVTGQTENLVYVSPKSGRAVCESQGLPWARRLLDLPVFMRPDAPANELKPDKCEIAAGLKLTGYFLQHWLFAALERKLPTARTRFVDRFAC